MASRERRPTHLAYRVPEFQKNVRIWAGRFESCGVINVTSATKMSERVIFVRIVSDIAGLPGTPAVSRSSSGSRAKVSSARGSGRIRPPDRVRPPSSETPSHLPRSRGPVFGRFQTILFRMARPRCLEAGLTPQAACGAHGRTTSCQQEST